MHPGRSSNRVAMVQSTLNRWGFFLGGYVPAGCTTLYAPDGIYGPCTEGAVKNFEAAHGFNGTDRDGIAGAFTMQSMQRGTDARPHSNSTCRFARNGAGEGNVCYFADASHPRGYSTKVYDLQPGGIHSGIFWWHQTSSCWTGASRFTRGACITYNQEGN